MNHSPDTLSPTVHLIDDDQAVRDGLGLLIGTVGLRVQPWSDPQAFLTDFDREGIGAILLDVTWSTWTVARPWSSITVRKTGFSERNASFSLPATVPALARFDAVVLSRTSCADMARPLMSKTEKLPFIVIRPSARASVC